jgi:hypothetical protein
MMILATVIQFMNFQIECIFFSGTDSSYVKFERSIIIFLCHSIFVIASIKTFQSKR